jgi:EAL domain-containing protein (putative c-di-GMP-specific phosphodiesterase class I)
MPAAVSASAAEGDAVRRYIAALAGTPDRDDLYATPAGRVTGRFLPWEIASVFQPVAEAATQRTSAAQALARVRHADGTGLPPDRLFEQAAHGDDLVLLDRRCRIVHTLNFFAGHPREYDLLLNVHERLLSAVSADHGRTFRRVLDGLAIQQERVVILLPPVRGDSLTLHSQVLASYRLNGFRVGVAVDQPELLAALQSRIPVDVVRVDAGRLVGAAWRRPLEAAHGAGVHIHATRVETDAQRAVALAHGATHLQGWLIGQPADDLPT